MRRHSLLAAALICLSTGAFAAQDEAVARLKTLAGLYHYSLGPGEAQELLQSRGEEGAKGEIGRRTQALSGFVREIQDDVALKRWHALGAKASAETYRRQVVDGFPDDAASARGELASETMTEGQFVAELLGLHSVGNNISRGEMWSNDADLDRLVSARLEIPSADAEASDLSGRRVYSVEGEGRLDDGSTLKIRMRIYADEDGSLHIGGGVG